LFSLFLLGSLSCIAFASLDNWVEVVRFEGNQSTKTEQFTCNNVEWRIKWEFVPSPQDSKLAIFEVFTYPTTQSVRMTTYSNSIIKRGVENTNGTSYIHDYQGTFYMNIRVVGTKNYTLIVEQNTDSIPEFPSWIILPLFLVVTFVAILTKTRLLQNTS